MIDKLLSEINLNLVYGGSYLFYGGNTEYLRSQALIFSKQIVGENTIDSISIFGDNKKFIGINDIRSIRSEVLKKSTFNQYKFIIINNADKMTIEAQNALLKTLENPREDLFIILIANDLINFLKTTLSRCILIDFNLTRDKNIVMFENIINSDYCRELYGILLQCIIVINYRNFDELNDLISNLSNYKQYSYMIVKMLYMIVRDIFIYKETLNRDFVSNHEFSKEIIETCKIYKSFNIDNILGEINKFKNRLSVNLNFELCYKIFILNIGR